MKNINFNKINNSYEFFMHLKKRKQKIKLFMPKNNFIKQKIKLSNIPIKLKLKNRWIKKNINNNINNANKEIIKKAFFVEPSIGVFITTGSNNIISFFPFSKICNQSKNTKCYNGNGC